jgi:hypothetical protein
MRKWIVAAVMVMTSGALALGASSEENRDESTVFVGVSPIGIHLPTYIAPPVGAGMYLGKNLLVGAEYGSRTESFNNSGDKASATFSNVGVYARWFPGTNSFNLLFGLHQRAWEASASVKIQNDLGIDEKVKADLNAEATVATLGLGNQWMADFGLTWGFDWLLLSGVASSSSTGKVRGFVNGASLSTTETQRAEKELKDLGNVLNTVSGFPGLLVFTIGWSF